MQLSFKALTINYKTAPVEVREKLSLSESECQSFLQKASEMFALSELFVLSTCNRTEIYYSLPENSIIEGTANIPQACPFSSSKPLSQKLIALLITQKGLSNSENYFPYFKFIEEHKEAVKHLFSVSMGLQSQVIGDIQISNQVKKAYQYSADLNLASPFLHRLLHTVFYTNKRVAQETSFRDGAASVSYAAAEMTSELAQTVIQPKVLVIGVGEIGGDVVRNLDKDDYHTVTIMNRTFEKAQEFAKTHHFEVAKIENLQDEVKKADVIICSVAANEPLLTKKLVEEIQGVRFKYLIDLSVPRSIEPEVEQIPHVSVFNIDQIQNRTAEVIERRKSSIPHVQSIIDEAIEGFEDWSKEMIVSPTIHRLKNALEQIRKEEINRHLKNLDEQEIQKIEKITKGMMQKIIKLPVIQLKAACKRGEAETLVDVLNDLFNLEENEKV
ncbi:glutamyl-tRNA reductase [Bernardetia litoralis DSM 6794]|uniref:Glutamyl-tRNA reductase n=1 Tax=Bernardetia litoralis (strain ATCC 23117 / DSM 6794 / NBRC 15988 / NCIMB 1366 / Fx l1 / Sio-4) TaxID=880071 RepID=I4AKZ0_BERLS|nr:glutamyl-tRNA reductase [Bernardetia litoralis]AFM04625.1 glutamyl-tRNA reductase [Bernardetia litoralis DSM 6794]